MGDPDALTALGYRLADGLWAATGGDELRAAAGMERALKRLKALSWPAMQELATTAGVGAGAKKRGAGAVTQEAPVEFAERLAEQARQASATLADANKRRAFWRLQAYAVVAALVLAIIMVLVSYAVIGRMQRQPSAMLTMLQFRIRHSGVAMELQDIAWDLPDPRGANKETARVLADAALALDEVANVPPAEAPFTLGYIAERVRAGQLPWKLFGAAEAGLGSKDVLMDAGLALEEVETWSPAGAAG
jgi:hypothetical protein